MTIRKKLYTLAFGQLLMIILAIGLVLVFLMPILSLNNEFSQLSDLAEQVLATRLSITNIISSPMELEYKQVLENKEKLSEQFELLSQQKHLGSINEKTEKAVGSILRLEEMFYERWDVLDEIINEVMGYSDKIMFSRSTPLINFYKIDDSKRVDDFSYVMVRVDSLLNQINITDGALASAYEVIVTQDEVIAAAIERQIRLLIIRAVIIFSLILIVVLLIVMFMARRMAASIAALGESVSELRQGRLDVEFSTASRDDIAVLGDNLNGFVDVLKEAMGRISESSNNNIRMKDELAGISESATAAASGIVDAVGVIREGMVDLDGKVAESGTSVNTVNTRTEELGGMLQEQTAMIEESTSAVTEMIASINNVSEITVKKRGATDELVKTAETGGEKLDETINIIQEITSNVDDIRSTASVIQNVAAQTSLLAMNAAIEAAHAGEAGAGFSVVAEEIRKLADASGTSSKRISGVLKEVVTSIEHAAASGDDTRRAFADINREVGDVASALVEISSSMDELSAGGTQILDAMTSLQGYTSGVQDGGTAMGEAAASLEGAFRTVEKVSSDVLAHIGGISGRIEELKASSEGVAAVSVELNGESERLDTEISRFSFGESAGTDDDSPEGSDPEALPDLALPDNELLAASVVDEPADQSS